MPNNTSYHECPVTNEGIQGSQFGHLQSAICITFSCQRSDGRTSTGTHQFLKRWRSSVYCVFSAQELSACKQQLVRAQEECLLAKAESLLAKQQIQALVARPVLLSNWSMRARPVISVFSQFVSAYNDARILFNRQRRFRWPSRNAKKALPVCQSAGVYRNGFWVLALSPALLIKLKL